VNLPWKLRSSFAEKVVIKPERLDLHGSIAFSIDPHCDAAKLILNRISRSSFRCLSDLSAAKLMLGMLSNSKFGSCLPLKTLART
jgi:hypothetical protein